MKIILTVLVLISFSFAVTMSVGVDINTIGDSIKLIKTSDPIVYYDFFDKVDRISVSDNGWSYSAIYKDSAVIHLTPRVLGMESHYILAVLMHELRHIQLNRYDASTNDQDEEIECYQYAVDVLIRTNAPRSLITELRNKTGDHLEQFRKDTDYEHNEFRKESGIR